MLGQNELKSVGVKTQVLMIDYCLKIAAYSHVYLSITFYGEMAPALNRKRSSIMYSVVPAERAGGPSSKLSIFWVC